MSAEFYVRSMANNEISQGRSIAFSGSIGCGKSKVARGIYRFARNHGPDIAIKHGAAHWAALWVDWKDVAESDDEDDFKEARQNIGDSTFVVLDDVGAEVDRFKTGIPASRLRRVLEIVERAQIWTVITTNLSQVSLMARYDARVADRLSAFQWMELGEVPSYRPKLNR